MQGYQNLSEQFKPMLDRFLDARPALVPVRGSSAAILSLLVVIHIMGNQRKCQHMLLLQQEL